ncbi:MAG: hydroxyacid dehydrogenase [Spirochaetes bacterium]|nr:hydroxyacid dehydrogenase [Spirochaetota bacterium]
MTLSQLLQGKPPIRHVLKDRSEIRKHLATSNQKLVVVDDDPTGTQTVHGIRVYMDWSIDTLYRALSRPDEVFYISTNSRALPPQEMRELTQALGANLRTASRRLAGETGKNLPLLLASRSDSTLRGHFPEEIDALLDGYELKVDGVILAPALFEAGRFTIDDTHWVDLGDRIVPAAETEFAKDPAFGYTKSNLKEWVEEKTKGRWKANQVLSLSLETLRTGGIPGALEVLSRAEGGVPIVVNAACYEDLETAVLALIQAEERGKRFAYRCAACFVKVRGGFVDRPLLSAAELGLSGSAGAKGNAGLVVVGSYVGKTGRQLDQLLKTVPCDAIELQVDRIAEGDRAGAEEVTRVAQAADQAIGRGKTAVVYTSRKVRQAEGKEFLEFGNRVMMALCSVVQFVGKRPAFVVAKGGITSIEIARTGMGVKEAYVPGQIAKGVPLWQLGPESKWPGIAYIVFPGNVGDDSTLSQVVQALQG